MVATVHDTLNEIFDDRYLDKYDLLVNNHLQFKIFIENGILSHQKIIF